MATRPTREQQRACDLLAEALGLIAEAARLDGRGAFARDDLAEVAALLAKASSAFAVGEVTSRALERRCRSLKLSGNAADLLTLLEPDVRPLQILLLADDEFRALVAKLEDDLGEI